MSIKESELHLCSNQDNNSLAIAKIYIKHYVAGYLSGSTIVTKRYLFMTVNQMSLIRYVQMKLVAKQGLQFFDCCLSRLCPFEITNHYLTVFLICTIIHSHYRILLGISSVGKRSEIW